MPRRLLGRLRASMEATSDLDPEVRRAGMRVFDQSERILDRLEGVAGTLQRVAELEVALLERMVPIVDDLGELVRLSLDEARERRGLRPRRNDDVIDVEAE